MRCPIHVEETDIMRPAPAEAREFPYRFTPVPRRRERANGWTSDRQHAFVWALARLPSVAAAARSVGMSPASAHRLRNAPGAKAFAQAWDVAWQIGMDSMMDTAIQRGLDGQDFPIRRRGEVVGTIRGYDNHMLMRALLLCDRIDEKVRAAARDRRVRNDVSRRRNV